MCEYLNWCHEKHKNCHYGPFILKMLSGCHDGPLIQNWKQQNKYAKKGFPNLHYCSRVCVSNSVDQHCSEATSIFRMAFLSCFSMFPCIFKVSSFFARLFKRTHLSLIEEHRSIQPNCSMQDISTPQHIPHCNIDLNGFLKYHVLCLHYKLQHPGYVRIKQLM